MKKLIKGLHKFQTEVFPIHKNFFQELVQGQAPEVLFVTCSDSRINPHLVTSAEPGDLFIMRNAGAIIPPYAPESDTSESATIEFAIDQLAVKHIIVCGHSHCGALKAVFDLDRFDHLPSLQRWIKRNVAPTLTFVQKNYTDLDHTSLLNILLQEHVLKQVEQLKTYPIIMQALAEQSLTVHAWMYKFETGDIFSFDQEKEQFEPIK